MLVFILLVLLFISDFGQAASCQNASFDSCIEVSEVACFTQDVAITNTDRNKMDLKVSRNNEIHHYILPQNGLYVLKKFSR